MDITENRYNKSTIFLLPLLYPSITYKDIIQDHYINSFISDTNTSFPNDVLVIEYENNVAHFKIPQEYLDDYRKILKGQYSQITDKSKNIIIKFWKESKKSYLYSILYRTDKILKYWSNKTNRIITASPDKEYWPPFNMNEEIRGIRNTLSKYVNFNLIKQEDEQ